MNSLKDWSNGGIIEFQTGRNEDYSMIYVTVSRAWYNSTNAQKEEFVEEVMRSIERISSETGVASSVSVYFYDEQNRRVAEPRGLYSFRILR